MGGEGREGSKGGGAASTGSGGLASACVPHDDGQDGDALEASLAVQVGGELKASLAVQVGGELEASLAVEVLYGVTGSANNSRTFKEDTIKMDADGDSSKISELKRANDLSELAISKVNELYRAFKEASDSENKLSTIQISQRKKIDLSTSRSKDEFALAQALKAHTKKEEPPCEINLLLYRIKTCHRGSLFTPIIGHHNPKKRHGIDLVMKKGSFAVPTAVKCGNANIDEMNYTLFNIYMAVDDLLEAAQMAADLVAIGDVQDGSAEAAKDNKAAVRKFRSTSKTIRELILSLGCCPLNEPDEYWRIAYPSVKF